MLFILFKIFVSIIWIFINCCIICCMLYKKNKEVDDISTLEGCWIFLSVLVIGFFILFCDDKVALFSTLIFTFVYTMSVVLPITAILKRIFRYKKAKSKNKTTECAKSVDEILKSEENYTDEEISNVEKKITSENHDLITSNKNLRITKSIVLNNAKKHFECSFSDKKTILDSIIKLENKNATLEIDTYTVHISSLKDSYDYIEKKFRELLIKTQDCFEQKYDKDLKIRFSYAYFFMVKNSKIINDICKKAPSLKQIILDIDNSMNNYIKESEKSKIEMELSTFSSSEENLYNEAIQSEIDSIAEKIADFNTAIKEIYEDQ